MVTKKMAGGCIWSFSGLTGKWELVNPVCVAKNTCCCPGEESKQLLHGNYPGFGKRV